MSWATSSLPARHRGRFLDCISQGISGSNKMRSTRTSHSGDHANISSHEMGAVPMRASATATQVRNKSEALTIPIRTPSHHLLCPTKQPPFESVLHREYTPPATGHAACPSPGCAAHPDDPRDHGLEEQTEAGVHPPHDEPAPVFRVHRALYPAGERRDQAKGMA